MKLLFRDYLGSGRVFFSLFFFYRFEASDSELVSAKTGQFLSKTSDEHTL